MQLIQLGRKREHYLKFKKKRPKKVIAHRKGNVDVDCLMHSLTLLLNALLFACNIAILPLDSVRTHGQSCVYIYTHF